MAFRERDARDGYREAREKRRQEREAERKAEAKAAFQATLDAAAASDTSGEPGLQEELPTRRLSSVFAIATVAPAFHATATRRVLSGLAST